LRSKSVPEGTRQGLLPDGIAKASPSSSRRKRTLLSFQRPGRQEGVKKASTRQRPQDARTFNSESSSRQLQLCRLQGLFYAALSGSRASVAPTEGVSTAYETQELALPGL